MTRADQKSWGSAHVAYVALVCAAAPAVGYLAMRAGMGTAGCVLAFAAVASLAVAPWFPALPLSVFVLAAYAVPRYSAEYPVLLQTGLLNWIAALALLGWGIWQWPRRARLRLGDWLVLNMALLIAWSIVCVLAAWLRGTGFDWSAMLHPEQFVQGWILMLLAAHVLGNRASCWILALALCSVPVIRTVIQGRTGVYLEGDVAALSAIALPIALVGAFSLLPWMTRAAFAVLAASQFGILALAQNRGAAVGAALALAVLWWNGRHRLAWGMAAIPVALSAVFIVPSAYLDRFRVLVDPTASHATAGLDRATVEERQQLWSAAWKMFLDHPWMGVGPGNSVVALERYRPGSTTMRIHNSPMDALTETGLVGLTLYVGLFVGAMALLQRSSLRGQSLWPLPEMRMVQAALAAYVGFGFFLSRYDMQLAYLLVGWAAALLYQGKTANIR